MKHKPVRESYDLELSIALQCDYGRTHNISIDIHRLNASAPDHTTSLERYENLELLGATMPQCYYACRSFNLLTTPFKRRPQKFWMAFDSWIDKASCGADLRRQIDEHIRPWLLHDANFWGWVRQVWQAMDNLKQRYTIKW